MIEHLGPPDSAYVNAAGNEVLRYLSRRVEETDVSILLLFSFDRSKQNVHTLHLEIKDDRVQSYWVE